MKRVIEIHQKPLKALVFLFSVIVIYAFTSQEWEIPEKYKKETNPYEGEKVEVGEKIYKKTCAVCHLKNGKGNDAITPADFTSEDFQSQTDGTLFYKISEGRKGTPMLSYGDNYPEKKIWYIVNYLRTFKKE